jgi:predicted GTPase
MSSHLRPIIERYIAELDQQDGVSERSAVVRSELTTLMFADALERKIILSRSHPDHPLQVVVVGPTQVGKSTLVSLLLGVTDASDEAGVTANAKASAQASAQAGFTVHCNGFAFAPHDESWLPVYFNTMKRQPAQALQRTVLGEYSYADVSASLAPDTAAQFGNMALWDTPDFDSVASFHYRSPVLQTMALADVVVMVVSKEKYADKSVWDALDMLALAGKPVIVVINKTSPSVRQQLTESVNSKYSQITARHAESTLPQVLFIDEVANPQTGLLQSEDLQTLKKHIADLPERAPVDTMQAGLDRLVSQHWHDWVQPISAHHTQQQQWKQMVQQASVGLVNRYQAEFLDNSSRHRETFQLAVAELLVLLEVPGMAEPLTRIRNIVTWPVRKVISTATQHNPAGTNKQDKRSEERRLLEELFDHGLTTLAVQISEQENNQQWWAELGTKLQAAEPAFTKGYHNELDNYQTLLKVETERAARALYTKLQEQPATLNSLRAARVSADAAAVVLAVKSGGLGAVDLVVAPAMLSLTSMLTEGALGQYMKKVQQDLKNYQKKAVTSLINRKLAIKLNALAPESGISVQQLKQTARHYNVSEGAATDD